MRMPFVVVKAVMDWRLLINFRVRPESLEPWLPAAFRPKLVHGWAMAGICLIRLEHLRPSWAPRWLGMSSTNAAHRIAVEWEEGGRRCEGVFIACRHTDSSINRLAGGRLFPGIHRAGTFCCRQSGSRHEVEFRSEEDGLTIRVVAQQTERLPVDSVFASLEEASDFFKRGGCGWSTGMRGTRMEGVQLHPRTWAVQPLAVERADSSFFNDPHRFPAGSWEFDSALLMRGVEHEWRMRSAPPTSGVCRTRNRHGTSSILEMP